VYLTDKGKFIVATLNENKEWVPNCSFTLNSFNYTITNIDDVYKLPYCAYLEKIIGNKYKHLYNIVSAMKSPEIEQLANMQMYSIAYYLYGSNNMNGSIQDIFGIPNKKSSLLAKYDINRKQLEYLNSEIFYLDESRNRYRFGIRDIKTFFNVSSIASLDYDTFVKYYEFVSKLDWSARHCFPEIPEDVRQKVMIRLSNMQAKHDAATQIFCDMFYNYRNLNQANRPNVDVYNIKSYSELVRLHDTCLELKRLQDEEVRRIWNMKEAERQALLEKKMEKLDKERSKLNYSDADFTIRLPEKLSEIVNEGSSLRHCVAGYTNNHAQGYTTIMFLRRNDDPTTSFYTIEIGTDNVIKQIHGFGNKWLGNNPEAIPTVMRWLRENNLRCTDQILLSTAKGYCNNNAPLVEKPII
jgi:hypothetical protein